jgi:hypothetical protein
VSGSLKWTGDALIAKMRAASAKGIQDTMSACVKEAKSNHTWENDSTVLEGSIGIAEYPAKKGDGVSGIWGSMDNDYALIHELGGTINHPGGTPYFLGDDGKAVFVSIKDPRAASLPKTKPHVIVIPPRPYLRPAADSHYGELASRIGKAFRAGRGDK